MVHLVTKKNKKTEKKILSFFIYYLIIYKNMILFFIVERLGYEKENTIYDICINDDNATRS